MRLFLPASFLVVMFLQNLNLNAQAQKITPQHYTSRVENAGKKSELITTPLFKSVDHDIPGDKWAVMLRSRVSHEHGLPQLESIKAAKQILKQNSIHPEAENEQQGRAVNPVIGVNFEANWSVESTPPDNSMAISNGGFIVTANNDGIEYYNSSGTFLYFDYWVDFFNDNSLTSSLFDPKVIYDSGSDRFVMVVLHGSTAAKSKVLVCFSKTNNPQNGWWTYQLSGNPLANNCWLDYPGLGVSNNEIYITGNLFAGNSFNQALIFQIAKAEGYAGNNLNWQYWYGLDDAPFEAFAVQPAPYGQQGNYGPGIYFVSNAATGDAAIRLWDLTDDISGNPQLNGYTINSDAYSPAADALQSGTTDQLDNGDCRILQAFYLNGLLHFVFQTDIESGWSGISYNRVQVDNNTIETSTFGLSGSYDYAYPALASFGKSINDRDVMIAFLRSSTDTYPQCRVVNCDKDMNWSPSVLVKTGETYIDFLNDDERWGDYSGMARKHNSAEPSVWLAASYGADVTSQNTFNTYKTWVAQVTGGTMVGVEPTSPVTGIKVFPNPAYVFWNIKFNLLKAEEITIDLFDAQGRMVKTLYQDQLSEGEHQLSFNKGILTPGNYFIRIQSKTKSIRYEKLVVAD